MSPTTLAGPDVDGSEKRRAHLAGRTVDVVADADRVQKLKLDSVGEPELFYMGDLAAAL